MKKETRNLPASVHDRLKNIANEKGQTYSELLQYYGMERFLYRLSKTAYREKFVLKGGLIFLAWGIALQRTTLDIDL